MPEFSSGTVVISSDVTSTGIVVVQTARLEILDGGQAFEAGAAGGGAIVVSGGGQLEVCTVSSGGTVTVLNEGYASDVTVESDGLYVVSSGGYATKSEVRSGGVMRIFEDVRATGVVVKDGGTLEVNTDGYARAPVLSQGGLIRVDGGLLDSGGIAGKLEIVSGGMVNSSTVLDGGELRLLGDDSFAMKIAISSGGTAHVSEGCGFSLVSMFEGASAVVSEGGLCTTVTLDGGTLTLLSGASLEGVTVNPGGSMVVSSGGTATEIKENGGYVEVENGANAVFDANSFSGLVLSGASATVHSGTTAVSPVAAPGGTLQVFSGGIATEIREDGGYVEAADGADVSFVRNTISGLSLENASATLHSGTVAAGAAVRSGGSLDVFGGGKVTGLQTYENGAVVSMYAGAVMDFDLGGTSAGTAALVNGFSVVQGAPAYTLTVSGTEEYGVYALADGAAGFDGTLSVVNTAGDAFGTLAVGGTLEIGLFDYSLSLDESVLTLTVGKPLIVPTNLSGTQDRLSWEAPGADRYAVELSADNFESILGVEVFSPAADLLELPAGTYRWRVNADGNPEWAAGEEFVSENGSAAPKAVRSNEDGNADLFFATTNGTWDSFYYARNVGSVNDWTGTKEIVSAKGRGRIQNLFFGSSDPNVLCLTDAENGDAIFVDDVFTDLPDEIETDMARLFQIHEIRAGAGDDIVDMTSQQFEYTGDGITIRGGDGDDIIWANKGGNFLFGDAGDDRIVGASGNDVIAGGIGNDRLHGGGGNDVFAFCGNWGMDTVQQLTSGTVTLWFASGDITNWNAETLTYTDGGNRVIVTGVAADQVSLKFGDDQSERFAALSDMDAFVEFTSRNIFGESGMGVLASMA